MIQLSDIISQFLEENNLPFHLRMNPLDTMLWSIRSGIDNTNDLVLDTYLGYISNRRGRVILGMLGKKSKCLYARNPISSRNSVNFYFTTELNPSKIIDFLAGPRLWVPRSSYPDFMDWLEKVNVEIRNGIKRGIVCYYDRKLVGAAIYQKHKTWPQFLELKNITIAPEVARRFVASFLVRNVEAEARGTFTHVICDAKKDNTNIRQFLTSNKYQMVGNVDLYGLRAGPDTVYLKELK